MKMNNKRKVGNLICVLKNESGHSRTDTLPMIVIAFVALVIVNRTIVVFNLGSWMAV